MIDAFKRASARRITAVIPYFGYARQDRKDKPRVPISAKLVADLLTTAGADRALIVDPHTPQLQGFFNIPVDHLFASPVLVDHFKKLNLPNLTVVSPDAGGVERARFFAKKVDAALAIVDKRRVEMNVAEIMHVIGDVNGRTCLIIDDLDRYSGHAGEDGGGAPGKWRDSVYACCIASRAFGAGGGEHSQLVIQRSGGDQYDPADARRRRVEPKIMVLSIAGLIGRAIQSIHEETSVSKLFLCKAGIEIMATTLEQNVLEAQPREAGTKNHARRVRREGKIPAVVYGAGKDAVPVSVDPRHVLRILRSESGHNTIFDLALNGGENAPRP